MHELEEAIRDILNSHPTWKIDAVALVGDKNAVAEIFKKSFSVTARTPLVVLMDPRGYEYSVANSDKYPYRHVRLLITQGGGQFPVAHCFTCGGGIVQVIRELPLSEENRKKLEKNIAAAIRNNGF